MEGSPDRHAGATVLTRPRPNPLKSIEGGIALLRGYWYRAKFRLNGVRFRAGRNFRVYGSLDVRGPGEVCFGNNVAVIEHSRPWTHHPNARLSIGNNVFIGSTRFGCALQIDVGDWCQLAEAYIMDTDFHSTRDDRRTNPDAPVRVEPVVIGHNVWIGHQVGILPGARIGNNSVVSFGSVCTREYPDNSILVGNPARVAGQVPQSGNAPLAMKLGAPRLPDVRR